MHSAKKGIGCCIIIHAKIATFKNRMEQKIRPKNAAGESFSVFSQDKDEHFGQLSNKVKYRQSHVWIRTY